MIGNAIGATVHVVAAALGLSALLATSTVACTVVKIAGAVYLVGLGVLAILRRHDGGAPGESSVGAGRRWARCPLAQGILPELLNPKTALYFMALFPHFVPPEKAPAALVFIVLNPIVVAMAMLVDLAVALFAGTFSRSRLRSPMSPSCGQPGVHHGSPE